MTNEAVRISPSQSEATYAGQSDLEPVKWIAIAAMAIDHYGKIVEPDLFEATHAIGRIAFPLLATLIGLRLASRPHLAERYVMRLLPWALVSQPIFVLAGRDWIDGNILLTLLLGVLWTMLGRKWIEERSPLALAGILVLLPSAWFVEFGPVGAAMVPITVALAAWRPPAAIWMSGPLGLAANLVPGWPPIGLIDVTAILTTPILLLSIRVGVRLPRLPTHFFYGFYPAHLLVLHYTDILLSK